jgi:hypothetical protein
MEPRERAWVNSSLRMFLRHASNEDYGPEIREYSVFKLACTLAFLLGQPEPPYSRTSH